MGFFDKLRGELVDIVEWIDHTDDTLVWRFPRYHNQIKNGAQLIVRPGQMAVLVHRGQLTEVFEPGAYELKTDNLPILSTLMGWKHGFDSPFKAEVYFLNTTQVTNLKWGTPNPIMLRDPDFGPIRLRAFGVYTLKAIEPTALLKELVGTDGSFEADEITELLRAMINSSFADVLGDAKVAALDLAAKYPELAEQMRQRVAEKIDNEYGLDIPKLLIVNISLPAEVEKALDTRTSMAAIGDMNRFQQYQMGQAMTAAAENPSGGGAADGMGLGLGFAMAGRMMQSNAPGAAAAPVPMPPPVGIWHIAVGGETHGPFTMAQLAEAAGRSQLTASTMVWTPGAPAWQPAEQVPQLVALINASTPPPPPPPPTSVAE